MKNFFKKKKHYIEEDDEMTTYKIAVDIGGTSIKAAVIDNQTIIDYINIPTPNNVDELIIDSVFQLVEQFQSQFELSTLNVGISTAGVVDEITGEIIYAGPTIANYKGVNFKQVLKPLDAKVHIYNDVNAALLGELSLNNYQFENIFCLTLGTGIGGAFYSSKNDLYNGERSRANEIGYMLYRPFENTTYEQRASTSALKSQLDRHPKLNNMDVRTLFQKAEFGNRAAENLLNNWGYSIAEGIAQIQILYDPGLILIGGGISAQQERLLRYITPHVDSYLPPNYGFASIQTMNAMNNAALFGAVSKF